jgi:SAM-dependent methyltransferase
MPLRLDKIADLVEYLLNLYPVAVFRRALSPGTMSMSFVPSSGPGGQGLWGPVVPYYYHLLNESLLHFIPLDVRLLVDVGCAAGVLGQQYKLRNPNCQYIGIERFAPAAEVARGCLDRVLVADVEQFSDEGLDFKGRAECLIYGDVLEHLVDPWRVLRQQVHWLRDGGYVVASVPNVSHMQLILSLVAGQWNYEEEGLLDRTHLRFFTYQTTQQLFLQAGLSILECRATISPYPDNAQWEQLLAPVAQKLGRDMSQFRLESSVLQYLVLAVKRSAAPPARTT